MSRRTVWEPPRVARQRTREMYERLAVNAEEHEDDEHAAMFRGWATRWVAGYPRPAGRIVRP